MKHALIFYILAAVIYFLAKKTKPEENTDKTYYSGFFIRGYFWFILCLVIAIGFTVRSVMS